MRFCSLQFLFRSVSQPATGLHLLTSTPPSPSPSPFTHLLVQIYDMNVPIFTCIYFDVVSEFGIFHVFGFAFCSGGFFFPPSRFLHFFVCAHSSVLLLMRWPWDSIGNLGVSVCRCFWVPCIFCYSGCQWHSLTSCRRSSCGRVRLVCVFLSRIIAVGSSMRFQTAILSGIEESINSAYTWPVEALSFSKPMLIDLCLEISWRWKREVISNEPFEAMLLHLLASGPRFEPFRAIVFPL